MRLLVVWRYWRHWIQIWSPISGCENTALRLSAPVLFRIRFLESDPAELWDFFGSGSGLDLIFPQAGSGLSKTFWTLFNFFAFFFPAKILLITWEFWSWMMWFILFFNLSRLVDFRTSVVRWRESHDLQYLGQLSRQSAPIRTSAKRKRVTRAWPHWTDWTNISDHYRGKIINISTEMGNLHVQKSILLD